MRSGKKPSNPPKFPTSMRLGFARQKPASVPGAAQTARARSAQASTTPTPSASLIGPAQPETGTAPRAPATNPQQRTRTLTLYIRCYWGGEHVVPRSVLHPVFIDDKIEFNVDESSSDWDWAMNHIFRSRPRARRQPHGGAPEVPQRRNPPRVVGAPGSAPAAAPASAPAADADPPAGESGDAEYDESDLYGFAVGTRSRDEEPIAPSRGRNLYPLLLNDTGFKRAKRWLRQKNIALDEKQFRVLYCGREVTGRPLRSFVATSATALVATTVHIALDADAARILRSHFYRIERVFSIYVHRAILTDAALRNAPFGAVPHTYVRLKHDGLERMSQVVNNDMRPSFHWSTGTLPWTRGEGVMVELVCSLDGTIRGSDPILGGMALPAPVLPPAEKMMFPRVYPASLGEGLGFLHLSVYGVIERVNANYGCVVCPGDQALCPGPTFWLGQAARLAVDSYYDLKRYLCIVCTLAAAGTATAAVGRHRGYFGGGDDYDPFFGLGGYASGPRLLSPRACAHSASALLSPQPQLGRAVVMLRPMGRGGLVLCKLVRASSPPDALSLETSLSRYMYVCVWVCVCVCICIYVYMYVPRWRRPAHVHVHPLEVVPPYAPAQREATRAK